MIPSPLQSTVSALAAVRPETLLALERVRSAGCVEPAPDAETLKALASEIRQIAAALYMVGGESAAIFAQALTDCLLAIAQTPILTEEDRALLCEAWNVFAVYMREAPSGITAVAMLYPVYAALKAKAGSSATPADLFYPVSSGIPVDATMPLPRLRILRAEYEQGLLEWLRGKESGLTRMYEALAGLPTEDTNTRFWRDVCGLIVALQKGVIESGREVKMLFGQLSRTIRAAGEADAALPVALHRQVLIEIAEAAPSTVPEVQEVIAYYQLQMLRDASALNVRALNDPIHVVPRKLGIVMLGWKAVTLGKAGERAPLENAANDVHAYWQRQGNAAYASLWGGLASLFAPTAAYSHELAVEVDVEVTSAFEATAAQLCGRNILSETQVLALADRLRLIAPGEAPIDTIMEAWKRDVSDRENTLRYQRLLQEIIREIRTDLQHIEQQISDYLRAPSNATDANQYRERLVRIAGAFTMAQMQGAADLANKSIEFVERVLRASPLTLSDVTPLAEMLCALQFYIDRLLIEDTDAVSVITPLLTRYGFEASIPTAVKTESVVEKKAAPVVVAVAVAATAMPALAVVEEVPALAVVSQETSQEPTLATEHASGKTQTISTDGDDFLVPDLSALDLIPESSAEPALVPADDVASDFSAFNFSLEVEPEAAPAPALALNEEEPKAEPASVDALRKDDSNEDKLAGETPSPVIEEPVVEAEDPAEKTQALSGFTVFEAAFALETSAESETESAVVAEASQAPFGIGAVWLRKDKKDEDKPTETAASVESSQQTLSFSDEELEIVEIFIEEARELLVNIANILASGRRTFDADTLMSLRRAFHTLKGSGRLANLPKLGDAAAMFEHLFDKAANLGGKPQPESLFALVEYGYREFSDWIATLETGFMPPMDVNAVKARIAQCAAEMEGKVVAPAISVNPANAGIAVDELPKIQAVKSEPQPAASLIEEERSLPQASITNDLVVAQATNSTRSLSAEISRLFLTEAMQYLQTLQDGMPHVLSGGKPSRDMVRAAHTLAGISRAMKLMPLADLSSAMEHWLDMRTFENAQSADDNSLSLIERGVQALEDMVDRVVYKEAPEPDPVLVASIRALVDPYHVPTSASIATPQQEVAPNAEEEDADAELAQIFMREAAEMEAGIGQAFEQWRHAPSDTEPVQEIARALHTLKGGARAIGAMQLGDDVHAIEERLLRWLPGDQVANDSEIAGIQGDLDAWYEKLSGIAPHRRASDVAVSVFETQAAPAAAPELAPIVPVAAVLQEETSSIPVEQQLAPTRRADDARGGSGPAEATLRVSTLALDHMLRSVNEAAIARSATDNDVRLLRESLTFLNESVQRLREQIREIEGEADKQVQARASEMALHAEDFDPLEFDRYTRLQELTRLIAESLHDVVSVQANNLRMVEDARGGLEREARFNQELRAELTRVRAVTFGSITPRLQRVVRQTARTLGKEAYLVVNGEQTEFDKTVLEKLVPPLEHMLRNSLAHGVEVSADRTAAGKPVSGEISITIQQDIDRFVLTVRDDGRGLNYDRIRQRGIEIGALTPDATPTKAELAELIFLPAFSTASEVTEVAGRGIGMDVVRAAVQVLGGDMTVDSVPGKYTSFRLHVPLTTLLINGLLVRAAGTIYAIPGALITMVRNCSDDEWAGIAAARQDMWLDKVYPLTNLAALLGQAPEDAQSKKILLLDDGGLRNALQVDEILGRQELAVKEAGPQLRRAPGIKGASILGNDQVVFIVNPLLLGTARTVVPVEESAVPAVEVHVPTVMVVDDSITVRKITSRFLARAGYQVILAKDGMEAVELLEEQGARPDAMLCDVEMPRMDGFEVIRRVRAMPALKHLPILMVTSRTAGKHREHAMSLGATRYIGKPYDEAALLEELQQCIAAAREATAAATTE